ncbi:MAG TPA: M23 family metallopeptidase [Chiayiivirga sp.]|nr:M23 family metallopeptidase [Chiayiivirga sp.]
MDVIIVSKFLKTPKKLSFARIQMKAAAVAVLGLILGVGAIAGYGVRALGSGDGMSSQDVQAAMQEQRQQLDQLHQGSQRELNAMSVKLAELQAEVTRINALGMRLTQLAHLEDGEFNFDERPAVGGPQSERDGSIALTDAPSGSQLGSSIDALSRQLSLQASQLSLLESVLSDRELDASLLPAGLPVRSGYASSGFGRRSDPFSGYNAFHRGVDFAGPRGSDVLSVADGVVQFSGRINGYGNAVEIDHGNGYVTRYAHNDKNLVVVGDRVKGGQIIAKMGSTGRSTGSHVHFEVWLNGRVVNPSQYLRHARG